ncbi:MAG: tetratricopeptide repeat protein [Crocinitomicaceae bacterium]|nr:tetratricopeptide repeat protein [Crocinitomicaceae bacterium]
MLNTTDIAKRIDQPNLVAKSELEDLKALAQKYPYTQLFSILYLKGLGQHGNVLFEDELQRHSYRISDRVQLFHLININGEDDGLVPEETAVEEVEEASSVETIVEIPVVEEPIVEEPTVEDSTTIAEVEVQGIEVPIEEKEETIDTVEKDPIIESPSDAIEENILHHAFAAGFQLDDLDEKEIENLEKHQNDKSKTIEEDNDPLVEVSPIDVDLKQSFTSWISSDIHHTEFKNEDKAAIQAVVNDFEEFDPSAELYGEVEKPKQEFFSPTKKAKESLDEDKLPVSQTLAKIYAMQGNYPKAIAAYEQLSLKYPEKKIFFANLIKDLTKKINT